MNAGFVAAMTAIPPDCALVVMAKAVADLSSALVLKPSQVRRVSCLRLNWEGNDTSYQ